VCRFDMFWRVTDGPWKVPAAGTVALSCSVMMAPTGTAVAGGKIAVLKTVTVMALVDTVVVKLVVAGQPVQTATGAPLNVAPAVSAVKTIVSPAMPAAVPANWPLKV